MAKASKGDKKAANPDEPVPICRNRRATFDYEISDRIECGVMLTGTEVKSLREGHANLEDAYARIDGGEVWLIGAEIPEYHFGNRLNHLPKRPRKLLMHRREITKDQAKAEGAALEARNAALLDEWKAAKAATKEQDAIRFLTALRASLQAVRAEYDESQYE